MITDTNRAYWFGASDTKHVIADNHDTQTWKDFWLEKCGVITRDVGNAFTTAGTAFEHPILDAIDKDINKDRQIILEDLRLRVNYDGDKVGNIFEVKSHKAEKPLLTKNALYQFLPKHIFGQTQVEIYAWKTAYERGLIDIPYKKLYVVDYPLYEDDFSGEPEVDVKRIKFHKVKYDKGFIKMYLSKLEPLAEMLVAVIGAQYGKEINEHIHDQPQ